VTLPEFALDGGRANHGIAWFALERSVELGHVLQCSDDAESRQRMRVGVQDSAHFFRSGLARPNAGEGEEEALVGGEAVDHGRLRLTAQRPFVCVVGEAEPGEVAQGLS
jgi:hypothetical protein